MLLFLKLYAVAIAVFLALDGLWIGATAAGFYKKHLGYLLAPQFSVAPAAVFYLLYAAGLVYLVVVPGLGRPLLSVFLTGALVGLMAYGAYDLTNQATIKDWPFVVTVVDMLWGAFVTGTVAAVAVYASRFL